MLTGKADTVTAIHKSGMVELVRSTGYCNLNDIAKTFGKRVDNWMRLKSTKDLIAAFESDPAYAGIPPFIASKGGRNEHPSHLRDATSDRGTWAHPDIAIDFAAWCDTGFRLWMYRQIRHLLQYGEVNLHYREWSSDQIQQGLEYNKDDIRELYG